MNNYILNTGVQNFIIENLDTDIVSVLLKKPFFTSVTNAELAAQIEARKKCQKKLPTWFQTPQIYYPNKLNIEQTSSEQTALYKAEIVAGKSLVDLTGGLGVDSYFFSKKIEQVFHCETDPELSQIANHNFTVLKTNNIKSLHTDGLVFLKEHQETFDWVYLDPSRRNKKKGKVFHLSDCSPDITANLTLLFEKSDRILLKTSPFLDISEGLKSLSCIKKIHIVAVNNEVKELLWELHKDTSDDPIITTINIKKTGEDRFNFHLKDEKKAVVRFSPPMQYLYEPNAALMKSGGFKIISNALGVNKLHPHSHLYTSNYLNRFPGRAFVISQWHQYNKRTLKTLGIHKANVVSRNFNESVANIRKKHRISDGGEVYLFFTKDEKGKQVVLVCRKVQSLT